MKWKVLVSAPYMLPVPPKYRKILEDSGVEIVEVPVAERLEEEDLLKIIGEIDGVICGDDRFTEKVYNKAARLKVVSKWGTGIDSINKPAAEAAGVVVRNTPNAFTVPVADTVLGYMLCFARKLPWMQKDMASGKWDKIPGFSLVEATLGVIGVGNIGKAVIKRGHAFGCRIIACDIVEIDRGFLDAYGVKMMSKDDLLKEADFVSVNCDLNATSFHVMGEREFGLMKPSAFFINTARGPLMDEKALVDALTRGKIAGAALDVFEDEPLPQGSPLRFMDNVMLAPHNSNSSPMAWERVHESTVNNLLEELRREK